jgi:hypothetical protein
MPASSQPRARLGGGASGAQPRKRKRAYHRLVKIHRSYTVEEAADLFGVHKNTIRAWIKVGLPVIDRKRPAVIHGLALRDFLSARRSKNRQACLPGRLYCVRCRTPKSPAGDMADYIPISATSGNLRGICPDCDTLIHRRVNPEKIDLIRGQLDIKFPVAESHIRGRAEPSVNSAFD